MNVSILKRMSWLAAIFLFAVTSGKAQVTLVSTGSVWKYLDIGSAPATWISPAFDDTAWPSGPAELGYGDDLEGRPEATVVSFGPDINNKLVTTYFRHAFTVANPAMLSRVVLRLLRDDGAIVYLNGVEVFRDGMPPGPVTPLTPASTVVAGTDETTFVTNDITPAQLVAGVNVLAVEVHQTSGFSSDISFDLELLGFTGAVAPVITRQPISQSVVTNGGVSFTVSAAGSTPMGFRWLSNGTPVAFFNVSTRTSTLPILFVRTNTAYSVVVTNSASTLGTTSVVANLTVLPDRDADRMPDSWETSFGFNPLSALDATLDQDSDGQLNRSEFVATTIPTNGTSFLRIAPTNVIAATFGNVDFSVLATNAASLSYQWRRNGINLSGATQPFMTLTNVAASVAGSYTVTVSNYSGVSTSAPTALTVVGAYTNVLAAGFNLIANHFDRGDNTLGEIMANVPAGSQFYKYNNSQQTWGPEQTFEPGLGWLPGGVTLNPGEGGILFSSFGTSLIFSGIQRTPQTVTLPPNRCQLLSMQIPAPGNFDQITGVSPVNGVVFQRWNQTNQVYAVSNRFSGGAWTPATPTNRVGEAVWICTGTGMRPNFPPTLTAFSNQTVEASLAGRSIGPINFTIRDLETPSANLTLTATSDNTDLLRSNNIQFGGGGDFRTLTLFISALQFGTAGVTVNVSDGITNTTRRFVVTVTPTEVLCRGFIKREIYDGIPGNDSLTNLTNHPSYPSSPTSVDFLQTMASPSRGDNYGLRLSGFFTPPRNAQGLQFQLHASRTAELSFGDTETNASVIARQTVCCEPVESSLIQFDPPRDPPRTLYYIQALMRATTGDDFIEVRWRTSDQEGYQSIPAAMLSVRERATTNTFLRITNQPVSQTARLNSSALFSVRVQSSYQPVFYQWRKVDDIIQDVPPWRDIPGANSSDLLLNPVEPSSEGFYQCQVSIPGFCIASATAHLTVDTNAVQRCVGTTKGTNFWLTIPGNASPDLGEVVHPYLSLLGPPGTVGMVEIPGLNFQRAFAIGASMSAIVALTNAADLGNTLDTIENKGIHVTASAEIGVVLFNDLAFTTDAYMVTPVDLLGRNHVVMAYGNLHDELPMLNGSQFALVAVTDDTSVQMRLSAAAGSHGAGEILSLILNKGQTFQLRATNVGRLDLTGTTVDADKPIAVFAGHQCATIPSSNVFFCNYVCEQILPTSGWGTNFFTVPLATRSNDTFRCLAMTSGTRVLTNGVLVTTLGPGQFTEFQLRNAAHVTASRPVFLAQFGNSSDYDHQLRADPTMITIPAIDLWLTNYMVFSPTNFTNYINVAARDDAPQVLLDGIGLSLVPSVQGGETAQVSVRPGPHVLTSSGAFQAIAYGYSLTEYDAYGYVAGLSLPEGLPPLLIGPLTLDLTVGIDCTATVPNIPVTVIDDCSLSGTLIRTQRPPAGVVVNIGNYAVTNFAFDILGNESRLVTMLSVRDLRQPTIQCSTNRIVECTNPAGNVVTFTNSGTSACGGPVLVVCVPPSGSKFPPGTTQVRCSVSDPSVPTNQCSFLVIVRDTTPPMLFCPVSLIRMATSQAGVAISYTVSATDNCDTNVMIVCSPSSGTVFPIGPTIVTCTATDDATNRTQCTFPVVVTAPQVVITDPIIPPGARGDFIISFQSLVGFTYFIESRTALSTGSWARVTNVTGQGQPISVTVPIPTNRASQFYRVGFQ